MPRKLIKRYLPEAHHVRDHRHLKLFGDRLHDPNLWHLNRRSVSGAFAVGLFCAFIPLPAQMLVAAAIAILVRVNLPLSVALVWVTNPLTIPPMFYAAYRVGAWVMGYAPEALNFEPTLEWFTGQFADKWQPFLLGCLIMGTVSAGLGYALVRLAWRLYVIRRWGRRHGRPGDREPT